MTNKRLHDARDAIDDSILIDGIAAEISARLAAKKAADENKDVLSDLVTFNKAKGVGDMDTMRRLATKYKVSVTTPSPVPPQPVPAPNPNPAPAPAPDAPPAAPAPGSVDDTKAPAWFADYIAKFGATDKDGKPTRTASDECMQGIDARLGKVEVRLERIATHYGYSEDANDPETFSFTNLTQDTKARWGQALFALLGVLGVGYVIVGLAAGWSSLPAVISVPVIAFVAGSVILLIPKKGGTTSATTSTTTQ